MGKRSDFERKPSDFYPTPPKGVKPLRPFLEAEGITTFAETCNGDDALTRELECFGFLTCVYRGDISTGKDALLQTHFNNADRNITNPPHTRHLLHPLIVHLSRIAPSWLLIDADWMHTKQAIPYLPSCTTIVTIGRLKWFEDSKFIAAKIIFVGIGSTPITNARSSFTDAHHEPETGRANAARRDGRSFLAATMEGEMMKIIQSDAGETPDATIVRRDFDDWSRYELEFRITFIDSAIEDLEVFDLKDGISALEDERERIEARLRDFDDDEEAEEDSV